MARNIKVIGGSTLYVHGKESAGGDADLLRIQSNSKKDYYYVMGHGGNLFFENTKVGYMLHVCEPASFDAGRPFSCDGRACCRCRTPSRADSIRGWMP